MLSYGELEIFFGGLESRLEGASEYRARAARFLGADFSIFRFIDYETQFSAILADLLDPRGSHGQGTVFLGRFLDTLEKRTAIFPVSIVPLLRANLLSNQTSVRREQPTTNGRFIDLVIGHRDMGLGIENKPWAGDQNRQLEDYTAYLRRRYKSGWMLLYISGGGSPPAAHSLPHRERERLLGAGNYLELSYAADLAEWLDLCIHACDSDKVRWFIRDFQEFVLASFKASQSNGDGADG